MNLEDAFAYAYRGIKGKKTRTWLTLIGIIIGIITIVAIVSIGDGVKKDISDQLDEFGTDKIMIMPMSLDQGMSAGSVTGAPNSGKLFEKDIERIEKVSGIDVISRVNYGRASVSFKDNDLTTTIYAADANMFEMYGDYMEIESGRMYKEGEQKVIVLGYDAANEMFGKDDVKVGNIIYINEEKYKVIGILKKIGTSMSQTDDSAIYVPFDAGEEIFGNTLAKNEIGMITIKIQDGFDLNEMKEAIEYEIAASHKVRVEDADFTVMTSDTIQEMVGGIMETLSLFLLLIAMIASIVSGVGIMNTMFMSIMEKTREIGVLKAVGASEKDITMIFLLESAIIGGIGGIIGVILGVIISYLVTFAGIMTYITPTLVIGAFLFAVSIGLGAGVFPAKRAARMNPIEALRK